MLGVLKDAAGGGLGVGKPTSGRMDCMRIMRQWLLGQEDGLPVAAGYLTIFHLSPQQISKCLTSWAGKQLKQEICCWMMRKRLQRHMAVVEGVSTLSKMASAQMGESSESRSLQ